MSKELITTDIGAVNLDVNQNIRHLKTHFSQTKDQLSKVNAKLERLGSSADISKTLDDLEEFLNSCNSYINQLHLVNMDLTSAIQKAEHRLQVFEKMRNIQETNCRSLK